jgi:hypothetical protein
LYLAAAQLGDLGFPLYSINELTLRQAVSPKAMLGRVNAGMQMCFRGIVPLGAMCGGAIAQNFGVRPALRVSACGLFAAILSLWFSPVRRLRALPVVVAEAN